MKDLFQRVVALTVICAGMLSLCGCSTKSSLEQDALDALTIAYQYAETISSDIVNAENTAKKDNITYKDIADSLQLPYEDFKTGTCKSKDLLDSLDDYEFGPEEKEEEVSFMYAVAVVTDSLDILAVLSVLLGYEANGTISKMGESLAYADMAINKYLEKYSQGDVADEIKKCYDCLYECYDAADDDADDFVDNFHDAAEHMNILLDNGN